jgi:hypothetical protein
VRGRRWKIQGARVLFIYFIQDCVLRRIGFLVIILNVINKYIVFFVEFFLGTTPKNVKFYLPLNFKV